MEEPALYTQGADGSNAGCPCQGLRWSPLTSRSYPECTYHYCVDTPGDHTVTQGFTDGLLTSVSQFATSITYHPDGLWATVVHSNDVTDHQDVDATGMPRPARLSTSGASENFDTGTYTYDGAGNIKAMGSFSYVYDLLSRVQDAQVEVPKPGCGEVNYVQNKKDTGDATYTSCGTVQAGPSYTVGATGDVTLQAGHAVVLADGFSVESGGRLTAGVDPNLDPAGLPTPAEQSYVYDAFGNLTSITTTFGGGSGQPSVMRTMPSDSGTNRLSGLTYDDSGNVTSWLTSAYAYDPFNMMTEADSTEGHFDFVYGPGDERLWVIDWTNGSSFSDWVETWTLRDINGSPLRQYRITGGNTEKLHWSADPEFPKDYAWRGGSLLGSVTAEGVVRHFHLDHLGSPRMVTDSSRHTLALHLYFPFGEEATDPSQDSLKLKFTGHERDDLRLGTTYDLDYMHARYYSPQVGRFFSFDPVDGDPGQPLSWNHYAYVLGNPVNYTDPYGLQEDGRWMDGVFYWANYTQGYFDFLSFGDFLRNLTFFNDNITVVAQAEPNNPQAQRSTSKNCEDSSNVVYNTLSGIVHDIGSISVSGSFPLYPLVGVAGVGLSANATARPDGSTDLYVGVGGILGSSVRGAAPSFGGSFFSHSTGGRPGGFGLRAAGAIGIGNAIGLPLGIRASGFLGSGHRSASVGAGVVGGASGSLTFGYVFHLTDPRQDGCP